MAVQKIASYEQRMEAYRKERRNCLLFEAPWIVLLGVGTSMGMLYLLSLNAPTGTMDGWWLAASIMGLALSWPPIDMMLPSEPSISDVAEDQALRRAFGMDDTVDDGGQEHRAAGGS